MKNSCKGCTWYKAGWCHLLDCKPDVVDPNCNYYE